MIIESKVWQVTEDMALSTIKMAKEKYEKMNVNAIVGVQKDDIISLQKDVYDSTDAFEKAITDWERGGYKCYHTSKKEEVK